MRWLWLVVASGCATDPGFLHGATPLATTGRVTALAATDATVAWVADDSVWILDGGSPRQVSAGTALGRIALASEAPYWEENGAVFGEDTMLPGTLVGGDDLYLARVDNAELLVTDPRMTSLWEAHYPIVDWRAFAVGAGKLVVAARGLGQTITLGTGVIATYVWPDIWAPTVIVPADDGFFFVDDAGHVYRARSGSATHLVDVRSTALSFAAMGDDLWFAIDQTLASVHPDGATSEYPAPANVAIARAGRTLVAITSDAQGSTLWRVPP
jgi:hypothetical protein